MGDAKGKAGVEVNMVDKDDGTMQAAEDQVGLIPMEQLSVSFDDAWSEYRAAALSRLEKLRNKRKARAAAAAAAIVSSSSSKRRPAKIPIPPAPPAREVDPSAIEFLFEKRLKYSDVKDDGRIVVPKAFAQKYLPKVDAKEGFFMFLDDMATVKLWMFRYRFWPNNQGKIFVFENTGDFIKAHGLTTGDFIMIYKDSKNERFVVGGRKANVQNVEISITEGTDVVNVGEMEYNKLLPNFVENENANEAISFYPNNLMMMMPTNNETSSSMMTTTFHGQNMVLQDFPMDLLNVSIMDLPEF